MKYVAKVAESSKSPTPTSKPVKDIQLVVTSQPSQLLSETIAIEVAEPLSLRERLLLKDKELTRPLMEKVLGKPNPVETVVVVDDEDDEMVHRPRRRQIDSDSD